MADAPAPGLSAAISRLIRAIREECSREWWIIEGPLFSFNVQSSEPGSPCGIVEQHNSGTYWFVLEYSGQPEPGPASNLAIPFGEWAADALEVTEGESEVAATRNRDADRYDFVRLALNESEEIRGIASCLHDVARRLGHDRTNDTVERLFGKLLGQGCFRLERWMYCPEDDPALPHATYYLKPERAPESILRPLEAAAADLALIKPAAPAAAGPEGAGGKPAGAMSVDEVVGVLNDVTGDENAVRIFHIARNKSKTVDTRLYELFRIDRQYRDWKSPRLGDLLKEDDRLIRGTASWKNRGNDSYFR